MSSCWRRNSQQRSTLHLRRAGLERAAHFGWDEAARRLLAAFDSVEMDYSGSEKSFRYGGGRDLSRLEEKARLAEEAFRKESP